MDAPSACTPEVFGLPPPYGKPFDLIFCDAISSDEPRAD